MKLIKGGIIGGIILFVWSAISWMLLPWHKTTIFAFKSEAAVSQAITMNAPQSGIYFMPLHYSATATSSSVASNLQGPMVFASVHLQGMPSMTTALVTSLIIQIIAAFFVTWLLTKTKDIGYAGRLGCVILFAIAAAIVSCLPYWNWFGFSIDYTIVQMLDIIIGWFFAGLVLAKISATHRR